MKIIKKCYSKFLKETIYNIYKTILIIFVCLVFLFLSLLGTSFMIISFLQPNVNLILRGLLLLTGITLLVSSIFIGKDFITEIFYEV